MKVGGLQMSVNGYPIGREGRPGIEGRDAPVTSEELAEMTFGIYSHVIEAFGPDRCMFESNFPVDKWGVSYRVLWNSEDLDACPRLSSPPSLNCHLGVVAWAHSFVQLRRLSPAQPSSGSPTGWHCSSRLGTRCSTAPPGGSTGWSSWRHDRSMTMLAQRL